MARRMLNTGWKEDDAAATGGDSHISDWRILAVAVMPGQTVLNDAKKIADARKLIDTLGGDQRAVRCCH